jgi:DNA-binding FrmR family transcriptional regulator
MDTVNQMYDENKHLNALLERLEAVEKDIKKAEKEKKVLEDAGNQIDEAIENNSKTQNKIVLEKKIEMLQQESLEKEAERAALEETLRAVQDFGF